LIAETSPDVEKYWSIFDETFPIRKTANEEAMRLSMQTMTSRTFTLHDVSESETIIDIKRRIEALESAPVEAQALIWGGCTLGYSTSSFLNQSRPEHDQHTLASCI
jgi:hypothetical protein